MTLTDQADLTQPHRSPIAIGAIAAFWIIVGVAAGVFEYGATRLSGNPVSLTRSLSGPLLAGVWWIPITLGAFRLARALPVSRENWRRPLLVHGATALTVSFVLNLAFGASLALAGLLNGDRVAAQAAVAGLRWLHINAAAYLVIVGVAYLLQSRRDRSAAVPSPTAMAPMRLQVSGRGAVTYVDVSAIDWIEGAGDYARVHTAGKEHLCSERLKQLEARLEGRRFVRIHRSAIVNVDRVRQLRRLTHGDCEAVLDGGTVLRVSRRRRQALEALLAETTG